MTKMPTAFQATAFQPGHWTETIDVRDFILQNLTPYDGDASFLSGITSATAVISPDISSAA